MIQQIFNIINKIINKIESTFYSGIVGSTAFQQIMGTAFILYMVVYGIMITFNLASHRSGEVMGRLIKLAIVYAITLPNGWIFFSSWIQQPILHAIDQIIVDIANAGSGSGGACVTAGQFSGSGAGVGGPITTSGSTSISLATGPMAMLFGPMTCIFASRFVAGIMAMFATGPWGWVLGLMLLWGMLEFSQMLLGAIVTYIKAIIGLTFLFGLAPIFFAFYLFQKSRSLTEGWMNMVIGFALQPVMLFTFLAFYAGIIGSAVANMFTNSSGSGEDICYVPWYTMPGLFSVYWWRFTNGSGAAGGHWINGASGSGYGNPLPPPAQVLSVLYFVVLCSLGKNFTQYIESLSNAIAGGRGGGVVSGREIGSWFKNNVTGGQGPMSLAAGATQRAGRGLGGLFGSKSSVTRSTPNTSRTKG